MFIFCDSFGATKLFDGELGADETHGEGCQGENTGYCLSLLSVAFLLVFCEFGPIKLHTLLVPHYLGFLSFLSSLHQPSASFFSCVVKEVSDFARGPLHDHLSEDVFSFSQVQKCIIMLLHLVLEHCHVLDGECKAELLPVEISSARLDLHPQL